MLVNTSPECTDISLRENKNQGQATRDRKILIFRILLLQSLTDAQPDTLIFQGYFFCIGHIKIGARYSVEA